MDCSLTMNGHIKGRLIDNLHYETGDNRFGTTEYIQYMTIKLTIGGDY
jgi:hypothetical protein